MIDIFSFASGFMIALLIVGLIQIAYKTGKLATYRLWKNKTDLDTYFKEDEKNTLLLSLMDR